MKSATLAIVIATGLTACGSRSGLPEGSPPDAGGSTGGAGGTSGAAGASGTGGAQSLCPPGSKPVMLASGLGSPWDIVLDDDHVYFSLGEDPGGVSRVQKQGGPLEQLASGPSRVHHLVLGPDAVFFAASVAGKVLRVSKDGTGLTVLADFQHFPEGIALAGEDLYWVYQSGGTHGGLVGLAADETSPVELLGNLHDPWDLKAHGAWLYFSTHNYAQKPRAIHRYHPKSGKLEKVFDTELEVNDFEVTEQAIYYTTNLGLSRYLVASGTKELLAKGKFITYGLVLTGSSVYAADMGAGSNEGRILRYDMQDATVTVVASGQDHPRHVAADPSCIYWTNQGMAGKGAGALLRGAL